MRIALIGDIHAYQLGVAPWRLLNRRLVGQVNLWMNRRKHFDMSLLPHVVERVQTVEPHWLMMSGDLTTTSLKAEFNYVADNINDLPISGSHCSATGEPAKGGLISESERRNQLYINYSLARIEILNSNPSGSRFARKVAANVEPKLASDKQQSADDF